MQVDIFSWTVSEDLTYNQNSELEQNKNINKIHNLPLYIIDDDEAGLNTNLLQSDINESQNGFLAISLTSKPENDVRVNLRPSDDNQFSINDRAVGKEEDLIFTPENWNIDQIVEIYAFDDSEYEGITLSQLHIESEGIDNLTSNYDNLPLNSIQIEIVDDDYPTASISLNSDALESGLPGFFQIDLDFPISDEEGYSGTEINYKVDETLNLDLGLFGITGSQDAQFTATSDYLSQIVQSPTRTGNIIIGPGEDNTKLPVVPINDNYADLIDKSFTVTLLDGEDYFIDPNSPFNSASVEIINDDEAGVYLIHSGENITVDENGNLLSNVSIGLLSQPASEVKLTLFDPSPFGDHQFGEPSSKYSESIVFNPTNYASPQEVVIYAYDDRKIEGASSDGLHNGKIQFYFESDDVSYSTSSREGIEDHFTSALFDVDIIDYQLTNETTEVIENALFDIQESINSLSVPIIGSLDGKMGDLFNQFIRDLSNNIRSWNSYSLPTRKNY